MVDKVSPEYFAVMGLTIRRGRGFQASDHNGAPPVVVISESMAHHIWPNDDAVGRCLYIGRDSAGCGRVVGVVEDARRRRVTEPSRLIFYVPIAQEFAPADGLRGSWQLLARTAGDPRRVIAAVRRVTLEADARVRFADVRAFHQRLVQRGPDRCLTCLTSLALVG